MGKKINPNIGDYFKHEGRIYQAIEPIEFGKCEGCFFNQIYKNHFECWAPPINCSGKIFNDVTDTIDAELVDDKKYNPLAVSSVLLTVTIIFWYGFIKLIIYIIHLFQ